jgi:hypothetical protein
VRAEGGEGAWAAGVTSWGGAGREEEEGGKEVRWMDKVEGFDLGRPSRMGRCKFV